MLWIIFSDVQDLCEKLTSKENAITNLQTEILNVNATTQTEINKLKLENSEKK